MENKQNERFFEELAKAYAEKESTALLDEWAAIEKENEQLPTTGLDRKLKSSLSGHDEGVYPQRHVTEEQRSRAGKRPKRNIAHFQALTKNGKRPLILLPLAASILVAILLLQNFRADVQHSTANAPSVSAPPATAPPASAPAVPAPNISDALQGSVRLVSASLPAGYTVTGTDYDNTAAVMEIVNEKNNSIILTAEMYYEFEKEGFSAITINESAAWALVKNDYCVLKYGKSGMLYTFTSMYGYEDLIEISREII